MPGTFPFSAPLPAVFRELAPSVAETLRRVFAASPFVEEQAVREPERFLQSLEERRAHEGEHYAARYAVCLAAALEGVGDETELGRRLRRFRRAEMARIACRDIAGWAELDETLADLTGLAEACLQAALDFLYRQACERRGVPVDSQGRPQNLVVLGMGKLGGGELNFSSDIDLIFAYREDGVLPYRETSHQEFFTRLAQSLVKALDAVTEDGFVFRVDTRLRPFGDSGPLVMSFDALENYYQSQAREWERYAMIKARPVAGDLRAGAELLRILKPFVYRRYIDFRAFGELRELKRKITQELQRRDRADNVKLGRGGIREIEFIGQAFQLIRGGQDKALRERRIQRVLAVLGERGHLPAGVVANLQSAYVFLRQTENRLQAMHDRQTHDLPEDETARRRLALAMGHADWSSFRCALDAVREQVHAVFGQVIASGEEASAGGEAPRVWAGKEDAEILAALLGDLGYRDPVRTRECLRQFRDAPALRRLSSRGAAELDRLMPLLLRAAGTGKQPDVALARIVGLLEAVAQRNVYYTLLAENPAALTQLVRLSEASPWIASYLARHPILLDELLDARQLYAPLQKQALREDLQRQLASVDEDDEEAALNRLRQFKQAQVLRVAAADIMDAIPLMVVSDYLTGIAEVLLETALAMAWRHLVARHGAPPGCGKEVPCGFGVIAYGKLGGIELGYGSDLDLVFLHRDTDANALTDGPRPVGAVQFYARLAQRIVHIVTAKLVSGPLYELDLRLRPNGNSGLPATSLAAFETYQMESAWIWEQQALTRTRFIAGDVAVGEEFLRIRRRSLARPREADALRAEVREMREKMRDKLASKNPAVFDLKQGAGGIADIEFLVQFGVLLRALDHPNLLEYSDNIRQLERLAEAGFLTREQSEALRQAYLQFRGCAHRAALQDCPALIAAEEMTETREFVRDIWRRIMELPPEPNRNDPGDK
jgi:glutamate-ammonia-ligase adenylyltransferase